jgi:ankyrin repeat protein
VGYSDIFSASYSGDTKAIENAVANGVNPNAQHPRAGTVPLQLACQGNAVESVKVLLRLGADPNLRFTWKSRVDGRVMSAQTALMYATSVEIASQLVAAGGDLNARDGEGNSPLVWAIYRGNSDLFRWYLERGADRTIQLQIKGNSVNLLEFIAGRREAVIFAAGGRENESRTAYEAELSAMEVALGSRFSCQD